MWLGRVQQLWRALSCLGWGCMKPDETGPRKPYAKPQLTRVMLRPEEAVLAACKRMGVGGPGQPTCVLPAACFDPAS